MVVILYRILASVSYDENVTVVNASIITEFPWTWWKKKRWLRNNSSTGDCDRPADHFALLAVWTMIPAHALALAGDSVFSSVFSLPAQCHYRWAMLVLHAWILYIQYEENCSGCFMPMVGWSEKRHKQF